MSRRTRLVGSVTGSLILTAGICTVGAGTASAAEPVAETFGYTSAAQSWTVPAGVTSIHVVADGAQGGQNGGVGARVASDLAVTPGQHLDIYVGGAGGTRNGGFNGGGQGGKSLWVLPDSGGGGGASDIRPSGGDPLARLMVAAGGGGSAGGVPSRASGGPAGADGSDGADGTTVTAGQGGEAGTASGGGAGGAVGTGGFPVGETGTAGQLALGGSGGSWTVGDAGLDNAGGGGGGGLFGGGGGGSGRGFDGDSSGGGGGGGGSSLDPDGGPAPTTAPAGNGQVTITYTPPDSYDFTGFFAPVDNPPALNQMNAGRTVPVKFSLDGDKGLDILAAGSPTSRRINCATNAPVDLVETTSTSNSGLTYDSASQQYQYNWKTEKAWSGTCREFTLTLDDGISHTANFQFK
ncbi:PxKF domain-containing protein [Streptomyces sp. NBC_01017]|uniref:PxKF domain-containing protein n=1 Tax=Streptomyces sp. NBC_01017 TaxID=2903721 RepID=UPI003866C2F2|nr:PxKF domain-containing protein [Streptomyces sp. NBC_01017]WSV35311.1 PxKF domain-containing protein [Streptomyces sp. NBC_01017]